MRDPRYKAGMKSGRTLFGALCGKVKSRVLHHRRLVPGRQRRPREDAVRVAVFCLFPAGLKQRAGARGDGPAPHDGRTCTGRWSRREADEYRRGLTYMQIYSAPKLEMVLVDPDGLGRTGKPPILGQSPSHRLAEKLQEVVNTR